MLLTCWSEFYEYIGHHSYLDSCWWAILVYYLFIPRFYIPNTYQNAHQTFDHVSIPEVSCWMLIQPLHYRSQTLCYCRWSPIQANRCMQLPTGTPVLGQRYFELSVDSHSHILELLQKRVMITKHLEVQMGCGRKQRQQKYRLPRWRFKKIEFNLGSQATHYCTCYIAPVSQKSKQFVCQVSKSPKEATGCCPGTRHDLHLSLHRENSFRAQLFMSISRRNLQYSSAKASNSLPKISKEASFNSTECFSTRQAFNSDSSFSLKQETQRRRTVSVRRNVGSIGTKYQELKYSKSISMLSSSEKQNGFLQRPSLWPLGEEPYE